MSNFKEKALQYLFDQASADKSAAEASLEILLNHPAGIGDHSTGDLHNNLNEALSKYADARDRLESLTELRRSFESPSEENYPRNP
jgi:hypothetical protein